MFVSPQLSVVHSLNHKSLRIFTVENNFPFFSFQVKGEKLDERVLHELLNEVDLNQNGQVDLMEFLQVSFSIGVVYWCF